MSDTQTVLVVGGTGRTGGRVVAQLLGRGVDVRAIVRSADRLPAAAAGNPGVSAVEADLLSMTDEELAAQVRGCDAVVSCLGHVTNMSGIFGPPRDLVTRAATRLCRAIEATKPAVHVRFILMSSVSVNSPGGGDTRRGGVEKACLWALRGLVPPSRDNQEASDFLCREIGTDDRYVRWVVVRPDTLLEGEVSEYAVHEHLVAGLFKPDSTNMANVAHFMCDLVTDQAAWDRWKGHLPVVVNAGAAAN
jgi:nucleoside-diphosphate-sugar epimerase